MGTTKSCKECEKVTVIKYINGHLQRYYNPLRGKKGKEHPMYGKHHTEEAKEKMRKPKSEEHKNKISETLTGRKLSEKELQSRKGRTPWNKGIKMDLTDEQRQNLREAQHRTHCGRKDSPETIEKRRQSFLRRWEDPEFAHKMHLSWKRQFNNAEKKLFDILQSISVDWKFVGDGTVVIGRFSPDFINGNKIIELFGNWWHEDNEVDERIEYFKSFGYDTIVIWEEHLEDPEYITKEVNRFMNGENMKQENCPHCGVKEGKRHKVGCEMEICPFCSGNLHDCNCEVTKISKNYLRLVNSKGSSKIRIPYKWKP